MAVDERPAPRRCDLRPARRPAVPTSPDPGEAEFRMLAVARAGPRPRRGRGPGARLHGPGPGAGGRHPPGPVHPEQHARRPPDLRAPRLRPHSRAGLGADPGLHSAAPTASTCSHTDTTCGGYRNRPAPTCMLMPRCRRRGIRCESGTVPQRCDVRAHWSYPQSPRTCRQRARLDRPGADDVRASRLGRWTPCGVLALPWARTARMRPPPPPDGPEPSEGEHHVTIAPADPAAGRVQPERPRADGPGSRAAADPDRPHRRPARHRPRPGRRRRAARPARRLRRGRAARAGHRGGRRSDLRGPRVLPARRPAADRRPSRDEAAGPGRHVLLRLRRGRPPRGSDRRPHRRVRRDPRGPPGRR